MTGTQIGLTLIAAFAFLSGWRTMTTTRYSYTAHTRYMAAMIGLATALVMLSYAWLDIPSAVAYPAMIVLAILAFVESPWRQRKKR